MGTNKKNSGTTITVSYPIALKRLCRIESCCRLLTVQKIISLDGFFSFRPRLICWIYCRNILFFGLCRKFQNEGCFTDIPSRFSLRSSSQVKIVGALFPCLSITNQTHLYFSLLRSMMSKDVSDSKSEATQNSWSCITALVDCSSTVKTPYSYISRFSVRKDHILTSD